MWQVATKLPPAQRRGPFRRHPRDSGVAQGKADDDKDAQQVLEVADIKFGRQQIYVIIKTGTYGLRSDLRDIRNNTVAYQKREYHADMMPFYFHFDLPKGRDKGLLALQRTGMFGIHGPLKACLTKEFKKRFTNFVLALKLVVTIRKSGAPAQRGSLDFVVKLRDTGFPFQSTILTGPTSSCTRTSRCSLRCPVAVGVAGFWRGIQIRAIAVTGVLTASALFVALLLNLLVMVLTYLRATKGDPSDQTPRLRRALLREREPDLQSTRR
jgi:hypothetical protein